MSAQGERSVEMAAAKLDTDALGYFRWGRIGGKVLVTNDAGEWASFSEDELTELLSGAVGEQHPRFSEMQSKGFLRDGLDLDALAAKITERNRHVRRGAHLHVLTLVSGDARMSSATAEKIVDRALQGTTQAVTFVFQGQGADPLTNFAVLREIVEAARFRNEQTAGKKIGFRVLTNLSDMNDEMAGWLVENDVAICTTLDGPAALHDANRSWKRGAKHADVVGWIAALHERYEKLGRDPQQWHVDAMVTVVRDTLKAGREVVDEYIARGLRTIHLHPLERHGFDDATWKSIGYSAEEYLDFRRDTLDYIIERNSETVHLQERLAAVVARKIRVSEEAGVVDLQSPCGAGSAEVAYDADGRVFPGDRARRLAARGDGIFELGSIADLSPNEIGEHATVRAIAGASVLDAQPMCADCWNKPYCGIDPVRNYETQGDLFGRRPAAFECKEHMGVSAQLFEILMKEPEGGRAAAIDRWLEQASPHATDTRLCREAP